MHSTLMGVPSFDATVTTDSAPAPVPEISAAPSATAPRNSRRPPGSRIAQNLPLLAKGGPELLRRQIRHGYIIGHGQGVGAMRPRVLAASISLVLILSGRVVVQTIQNRSPDHDHPAVGLPGVRQLALKPFTTLPKGVLFLRLENFSTTRAAEDAATSASAVVEWAGKIWLFTLGPMGVRSSGGTLVAEIGPVPDVPAAASYVLDVNEADFGPEMKAQVAQQVHTHPGPEIFYLLTGEQCLETPNGTTRARAGEGMVAPAHTPMQLNIMGSSKRDAFFVVVHDATKPRVTPSDWQPTGTCK